MKSTVPLYSAISIGVIAVLLSAFFTAVGLEGKATSEESHLVLNFIQSNGLPTEWEARFHAINTNWPPSRNALGGLLLDAQLAVAQRASK